MQNLSYLTRALLIPQTIALIVVPSPSLAIGMVATAAYLAFQDWTNRDSALQTKFDKVSKDLEKLQDQVGNINLALNINRRNIA